MKEGYRPPSQEKPSSADITRRGLLRGLGALGALGVAGAVVGGYEYLKRQSDDETIASVEYGEQFEKELSGYLAQVHLRHDEIVFLDEDNVPLSGPVNFSDAIGERYKQDGICISPPPRNWRVETAAALEAEPENEGRKVVRSLNVALIFKAALEYKDESALQTGILDGSINTFGDIVNYFASKPVLNADGSTYEEVGGRISRQEYVRERIVFKDNMPTEVGEVLRNLIPGICAQESKFNNGLRSKAGARGVFQFMPWVWEKYGRKLEDFSSLKIQTEAAGELFSDIYREVLHHCDEDALLRARQCFDSTETFQTSFIVPLLINSYNAGSSRVADAVNQFFTQDRDLTTLVGLDVFLAMADDAERGSEKKLSGYKQHAREYVSRVYAHAVALNSRRS